MFKKARLSPEEFLQQPSPSNHCWPANEEPSVTPVHSAADFSYRNSELAGDRWMLAGDAAGFIDPVFSSGVFLAILGGEQCADVLHEVLDHPRNAPPFCAYDAPSTAMDVYLRFVNAWYSKEFIEVFLNPTEVLQIPHAVNAVLAGNVGTSSAIKWRMWIFYSRLAAALLPLCPRRTQGPSL